MGKLERPIIRWAIASLFFAVELLFFVVIPDPGDLASSRYEITRFNQAIMTVGFGVTEFPHQQHRYNSECGVSSDP
jgi:hypothetical protein